MNTTTYKIFSSIKQLPKTWDKVAAENVLLQKCYLSVLEQSAPTNMQCFFIAIYENDIHIGIILAQYFNVTMHDSFGERDKCFKTIIRNFVFKNFASNTLFIGNNMITGQNGYAFINPLNPVIISKILFGCCNELITYLKNKNISIQIVSFKDFYKENAAIFKVNAFKNMYEFNVQPNMIFELNSNWNLKQDYVDSFSKKYRDQYKRARKKFDLIEVRELNYNEILEHQNSINKLYNYVAKNAPFNTFFLAENHFSTFKKECQNEFFLFGYFFNNNLVGFHTVLINGEVLETYFLGYEEIIQKEKMLYLNMLYNMTEYGIEKRIKKIIFGRTAIEIKSSIGAKPVEMSGFIFHTNSIINKFLGKIFDRLEPKLIWQERHPFKEKKETF